MAATVVGGSFWELSTGWACCTFESSNDELDGVLRTDRMFNLVDFLSPLSKSNSAVTKVDCLFVFSLDSIDTMVTRPRTVDGKTEIDKIRFIG